MVWAKLLGCSVAFTGAISIMATGGHAPDQTQWVLSVGIIWATLAVLRMKETK